MKRGVRAGCKMWKLPYWLVMIDRKFYLEHRLIFLLFNGYLPKEIDHIDDALTAEKIKNNNINNLQEITRSSNKQKSKINRGRSKYRGVNWLEKNKKWRARIRDNYKHIHLGCFDNEEDAARAYDIKAKELHGEHCYLNFK